MLRFTYKAKDLKGKYITGLVESRDIKEAAGLLRDRNLFIIHLKVESSNVFKPLDNYFSRVTYNDIVAFTSQLATMVTAGLTLSESLSILVAQLKKPVLKKLVIQIQEDIQGGKTFASSIEKYPKTFSPVYISLVRAGEASGKLDDILQRLAENMEKTRSFNSKVKGAMVYPVLVIIVMICVAFAMMILVVPKLTAMYKDFDASLPLPTVILITVSDFFSKFWYVIIGVVLLVIFLFSKWQKTKTGAQLRDKLILKIPIFGHLIMESTLVEVTRTLSILIAAGIPILEAIEIAEGAVENLSYKNAMKDIENAVEKGFPMAVPFNENPLFPPILGQMVSVGEQTGKLDETLLKMSKYFEEETNIALQTVLKAIEPMIIVVLGVGVLFLVMSIMLPIYDLTNQF